MQFLRIDHAKLREIVLTGGTDDEILEWCYANDRRVNEGDVMVWNGSITKLGWNDFGTPFLEHARQKEHITDRTDTQRFRT